jgi:hypothetical protein
MNEENEGNEGGVENSGMPDNVGAPSEEEEE